MEMVELFRGPITSTSIRLKLGLFAIYPSLTRSHTKSSSVSIPISINNNLHGNNFSYSPVCLARSRTYNVTIWTLPRIPVQVPHWVPRQ